jgi:hypothetical protein
MIVTIALELSDVGPYLAQLAITILLVLAPIFAVRAVLPRSIRRQLRFGRMLQLVAFPIRGLFRLLTMTVSRERALPVQQLILHNFPLTPLEFFAFLEAAIERRNVPGLYVSLIARREVHLLSSRRWYLHLSYDTSVCIIGATPVGSVFVISWRLGEIASWANLLLREYPGLHQVIDWFLRPPTFYRIDLNTAFQQLARQAVADAVDQITQVRGLRALNEAERQQLAGIHP